MSGDTALRLAVDRPQRVLSWGFAGQRARFADRLRTALGGAARITASWDPPRPDPVLSQARVKVLLGEFSISRRGSDFDVDPAWLAGNLVRLELPVIGARTCHRMVMGPLREALAAIEFVGLGPFVDVGDSRRAGNCFNGREVRTAVGTSGRNLSRHSWAAAIDINPSTNRFGAVPRMNRCVVEIFRSFGFAWGGTFAIPDGMHFEYVGRPASVTTPQCAMDSRRELLSTTTTTAATTTTSATTTTTTTTMTATITTVAPVTTPPTPEPAPVASAITAPLPPPPTSLATVTASSTVGPTSVPA